MDRVRFGRALGYGARHAAKTLMAAADAATAPSSSASQQSSERPAVSDRRPAAPPASTRSTPISAARVAAVSAHASASGRSVASSVKRASSTVMLQVIGTFFALFAFTFAGAVWRLRAAFRMPADTPEAHKLYAALLMFVIFSYFTASSFLRARKLEKA